MSSTDYAQVGTIVNRLGDLLSLLNPVKLAFGIAEVLKEISVPPPGDPGDLRSLAGAFRAAGTAIGPIGGDVGKLGTDKLPQAWEGGAATEATEVLKATDAAIDRTPDAFTGAAKALDDLADAVEDQRNRHEQLHQSLRDAVHDATHVEVLGREVSVPDPTAAARLVDAVAELIRGCLDVYTDALSSADRATGRFVNLASEARAAAAVDRGLAPDDAIVLAGKGLKVATAEFDDGILNPSQLTRAGEAMDAMSPQDRAQFDELLNNAGSDTERAWLLKALAAGNGVTALGPFADKIRGRSDSWLNEHLSLIDQATTGYERRNGVDVEQYEDTTCGTTSLIVARAQSDPLYALSLTEGDFEQNFKAERDRVHDETNVIWPEALGTSPEGMADYMSRHSDAHGTDYDWHLVDDTDQREVSARMREVVTAVDAGHPVPILVGDNIPQHYVLVVGHSGGEIMVYDPANGQTHRIPESDFLDGDMSGSTSGWDHVQGVVTPKG